MRIITRTLVLMLALPVFFLTSCVQDIQEPGKDIPAYGLETKAVNTSAGALEGNLIIRLSDELALSGADNVRSILSADFDYQSLRPVFPSVVLDDDIARRCDRGQIHFFICGDQALGQRKETLCCLLGEKGREAVCLESGIKIGFKFSK